MPIIIAPILRMLLASAAVAGAIASQFPTGLNATVAPATSLAQTTPSPTPSPTPTPTATTPQEQIAEIWKTLQLTLIAAGGALSLYLIILWTKPQLLLKLPSTDLTLPWVGKIPMGIVRWLKYPDRVLDHWVEQCWQAAKEEFNRLQTVEERQIHIDLPVRLDKELIPKLTAKDLVRIFKKNSVVVLITAEGGAGKTSLACQIAQWGLEKRLKAHRMLPVLIENELDEKETLLEAIRGLLTRLTDQPEEIAPELLQKLLQRQRVLVIVDHLSEMGDVTRKQVTPDAAEFPARALIITSRSEEEHLKSIPRTVLRPLQVEGNRLTQFMDTYLELQKQRDLFENDEFLNICLRLSRMVGQRTITVLLARLYADQMIERQQGTADRPPDSIRDLMFNYLNQLNRQIPDDAKRDEFQVRQDAQFVAWECLRQTYQPTTATRQAVLAALESQGKAEEARARLQYLEQRLRLVQPIPPDRVKLSLDPLAEYLAAAYRVDTYCQQNDPTVWQALFTDVDAKLSQPGAKPEFIQGFLLAMRDCCLLMPKEANIPAEVPDQLADKAGLDPEQLREAQDKYRVRLAISDLAAPELEFRMRAIADLGDRLGPAGRMAVPYLLGMIESRNQEPEVRQLAIATLSKLGRGTNTLRTEISDRLLTLLNDPTEDLTIRRSVAEALGEMKAGKAELKELLYSELTPLTLRQGAARAIRLIGASSGEAIPMLIVELQEEEAIAQVKSIPVLKEPLDEDLTLDLVAIPGGKFLMGSPSDEVGRDWYSADYFADIAGLDVEAQHEVTVQPFWMSQYPITQAQWRAIATLPKIDRDLDPDPANFKGDRRPVETVSWYDAMEFCTRLSQHTGKTYRLPSEAEWEYACRAGTTTPFHFGATLDGAIANYDGRYTYGEGSPGDFRNQTVEVGSFGVVNAFGLAEMHGTVWEWCLDHWHPSYEGAPSDGSAWVTDGNDRFRLLRGGSWYFVPGLCRSAIRNRHSPGGLSDGLGFRLVCVSPWT